MTIQNQILDRFVMRIKESGSLENVRFVHSNNMTPVQQPVSKFTVCCSVERSVLNDGYISGAENLQTAYPCEASLSFIIYAPKHTDGRALTEFAEQFSFEIAEADREGVIRSSVISAPYYDRDVTALRCEVTVKISFICGKAVRV